MSDPVTPKLRKPATLDHLRKKKPYSRRVGIVLDTEVVEAYERAEREFDAANTAARVAKGAPAVKEASRRLSAAQAALDEATKSTEESVVVMTFRSIGRKNYDRLMLEHPAPDSEVAEAKEKGEAPPSYNEDTFPRALIQASCADPVLDNETMDTITNEWNSSEITQLWVAALEVNTQVQVPDLGKA